MPGPDPSLPSLGAPEAAGSRFRECHFSKSVALAQRCHLG